MPFGRKCDAIVLLRRTENVMAEEGDSFINGENAMVVAFAPSERLLLGASCSQEIATAFSALLSFSFASACILDLSQFGTHRERRVARHC
jgi:hypothetical protein